MTFTATRIEISPTEGVLGAIVTGVDASRPVESATVGRGNDDVID